MQKIPAPRICTDVAIEINFKPTTTHQPFKKMNSITAEVTERWKSVVYYVNNNDHCHYDEVTKLIPIVLM